MCIGVGDAAEYGNLDKLTPSGRTRADNSCPLPGSYTGVNKLGHVRRDCFWFVRSRRFRPKRRRSSRRRAAPQGLWLTAVLRVRKRISSRSRQAVAQWNAGSNTFTDPKDLKLPDPACVRSDEGAFIRHQKVADFIDEPAVGNPLCSWFTISHVERILPRRYCRSACLTASDTHWLIPTCCCAARLAI